MNLRSILSTFWRRAWIILLAAALGGLLGLTLLSGSGQRGYVAQATIAIGGDIFSETQDRSYLALAEDLTPTYIELARMDPVTTRIVQNLGLPDAPWQIANQIQVTPIEGTQFLTIRASYTDPDTAVAIANEVARQLAQQTPPRLHNFILLMQAAHSASKTGGPSPLIVIITAMAAGLLATGGVFLAEYLREPINDAQDVEEYLGLPVLNTLRPARFRRARSDQKALWWSLARSLCHRWQVQDRQAGRVLVVTSPTAGQGSTLVAHELAQALVNLGCSVTWVGAGLEEAALKQEKLLTVLQEADPTSLKNASSDVVIVPGAPPLSSQEAARVATEADEVLLVIQARHTRRAQAAETLNLLAINQVPVWGVVLSYTKRSRVIRRIAERVTRLARALVGRTARGKRFRTDRNMGTVQQSLSEKGEL